MHNILVIATQGVNKNLEVQQRKAGALIDRTCLLLTSYGAMRRLKAICTMRSFYYLCKLGLFLLKPPWDYRIEM